MTLPEQSFKDNGSYPDCLGGGRYCASSRKELYDILDMVCLHKIDPAAWWSYNNEINNFFNQLKTKTAAAIAGMMSTEKARLLKYLSTNISECVNQSFTGNLPRVIAPNLILDEMVSLEHLFKPQQFPLMILNNKAVNTLPMFALTLEEQIEYYVYKICN